METEQVRYEMLPAVATVEEVGRYLKVGRGMAYRLVREGAIRSIRAGRIIRIPRAAVLEYLGQKSEDNQPLSMK